MTTPAAKSAHYAHALALALTSGQWTLPSPAQTPTGVAISWSELLRKFRKHSPSPANKARADVAEKIYFLSHTLAVAHFDEEGNNKIDQDYPLQVQSEVSLLVPEAKQRDVGKSYRDLRKLEEDGEDGSDILYYALAYHAYSLSKPEECLLYLEMVPQYSLLRDLLDAELRASEVPAPSPSGSTPDDLLLPSTDSSAAVAAASTPSLLSFRAQPELHADSFQRDTKLWAVTELLRAVCLKGMATELLNPTSPQVAVEIYASALPLLSKFHALVSATQLQPEAKKSFYYSSTTKLDSTSAMFTGFSTVQEGHSWAERLLWRWTVCAAHSADVSLKPYLPGSDESTASLNTSSLWAPLTLSSTLSTHWPPSFHPSHRVLSCFIHLKAFLLLLSSQPEGDQIKKRGKDLLPSSLHPRSVIPTYRTLLNTCTSFPRAGKRNFAVEDCVSLVVECQRVGLVGVSASLDLLWWATTLTFNAPIIYRNMAHLLYLNGDLNLARRCLRVYSQVVSKAWETTLASTTAPSSPKLANLNQDEAKEESTSKTDPDTHIAFVRALIFGARMLAREIALLPSVNSFVPLMTPQGYAPASVEHSLNAKDMLKFAREMLDKVPGRLGFIIGEEERQPLERELRLAEGIVDGVAANRESDPSARARLIAKSHESLLASVSRDQGAEEDDGEGGEQPGTASAWYHLALSWLRVSSLSCHSQPSFRENQATEQERSSALDSALRAASLALEKAPSEARCWHLLGLVLGVMERWSDAKGILERGCEAADVGGEEDGAAVSEPDGSGSDVIDGLPPATEPHPLLSTSVRMAGTVLPLPSSMSSPFDLESDFFPVTSLEKFERSLQIRMSLGSLVEKMEGAEAVGEYWVGVFAWVSEKLGIGEGSSSAGGDRRASTALSHEHFQFQDHDDQVDGVEADEASISIEQHEADRTAHGREIPTVVINGQSSAPALKQTPSDDRSTVRMNNLHLANAPPNGTTPAARTSVEIAVLPPTPQPDTTSFPPGRRESISSVSSARPHMSASDVLENQVDKLGQTGKKVQKMLKDRVQQGTVRISTMTRNLNLKGGGGVLRRSGSAPDFHSALKVVTSYQASSIHSRRRRLSSKRPGASLLQNRMRRGSQAATEEDESSDTTTLPAVPPPSASQSQEWQDGGAANGPGIDGTNSKGHVATRWKEQRRKREARLISDLWLMCAASFRRAGKIDQCKAAIQEAEVRDEGNVGVWVQLGLYYHTLGRRDPAIDAFQKALFINPDDVSASVHLSRLWLEECPTTTSATMTENVDLAAGLLEHLTRGPGWDVPEAWYFLGKAYGMQGGRKEKERAALEVALGLSRGRGVRSMDVALAGGCL